MLNGLSIIGHTVATAGNTALHSFSTVTGQQLAEKFYVATEAEIEQALKLAQEAAPVFAALTGEQRARFLETIATEILSIGSLLIERAHLETGLPEARLNGERDRTVNQLRLFAAVLREGSWVQAVIDTALPDRKPLPRTDLRKMQVALGPVAVFAASNFPFAFSTAGGDTAAALAAGCPVIVKAHGSHLGTNELIAQAVQRAAILCGMPNGVFSALVGEGAILGQQLAKDARIKAIGFTGSFKAGMSLYRTATTERKEPIPVYAEMSSINPVLLLPVALSTHADSIATQLAGSITLGVGQFCTNPGLLFVLESEQTAAFIEALTAAIQKTAAGYMLNKTICKSYYGNKSSLKTHPGITVLTEGEDLSEQYKGSAALFQVNAANFINDLVLQEEVFGPSSLVVRCSSKEELKRALEVLQGQLTGSVFAEQADLTEFSDAIAVMQSRVGRLIFNQVPTGVEVCHAMVHGGPFPATADARSTSVGADSIQRFVRPLCWQNCPEEILPAALKNSNPLQLMRKINGIYTRDAVDSLVVL
ncbi:aldehyde dehydrogenase (NADP(+)) [Flavihumibacter sp. CACIAM 22H1]|uniref:aldehyde dehydrogenase (NADP(+)) n=1 Tax=Flavihumibacter sp. CACIAM 22H1 TaxID=1812911 RepID=UPI000B06038B|nr:aldehyde dehydrogenase (NADP(+)) [Flavihumibacter sp. CACIAM 22H1]